jgi:molybdate transport system substrate-binding protein
LSRRLAAWAALAALIPGLALAAAAPAAGQARDSTLRLGPAVLARPEADTIVGRPAAVEVPPGNLKLFAASSLQNILAEVAGAFELRHPGLHVVTGVAGSADLRAEIEKGADADVFLSADTLQVAALVRGGICDSVRILTRNRMAVLVRAAGPVSTLADLATRGVRVAVCTPDVAAGRHAGEVLEKMARARGYGAAFARRVKANITSRESSARAAVAKVALGQADAAFAYPTDLVVSRKKLAVIPLSDTLEVRAVYGVAICRQGRNPIAAAEYVRFLFTAPVRAAFLRHGFESP